MSLIRKLLSHVPFFDIGDGHGDTFYRRWKLLKTPWFSVYLHQFFRSDYDLCLHDHPWSFATLILRGGYWEIIPEGRTWRGITIPDRHRRVWRRPGYFGRYPAWHAHRIEIEPETRPWSLVVVGRKSRPWGFWSGAGWSEWKYGEPNPVCEP